ncbi:Transcription factor MBP1 [Nakaseomyces bracarensis]|uniref:Transcription factor MBP1 n=1 Tax=Nakaseomyces bracarensis TaxID=273131 RepID=A0ABR4NNL9_9SACH
MSNQIYSAKYSGVDVYEFIHPTGSIMKRKNDGWVNATHILKAANFAKAKRTRILEKEVLKEKHEKVQGGFGKYQGTWVPLDIAINLAEKFEVYSDLKPLFDFSENNGDAAPPPAPKHHHASKSGSTKVKKAGRSVSTPAMGEGKTRASTRKPTTKATDQNFDNVTVVNPVVTRRRGRPPNSTLASKRKLGVGIQRSQSDMAFAKPEIPNQIQGYSTEMKRVNSLNHTKTEKPPRHMQLHEIDIDDGLSSDIEVPDTELLRPSHQSSLVKADTNEGRTNDMSVTPSSSSSLPTSPSHLTDDIPFDQRLGSGGTSPVISLIPRYSVQSRPQATDINEKVNDYLTKLVDYFISNEMRSSKTVPQDLLSPPPHSAPFIDAPIDPELHTAFHWACSMGNLPILEALYNTGTNIRAANSKGQTPLMRSAMFHNSYTRRSFPRIFELLSDTVFDIDSQGQTVLHHIVKRKSSTPSAIYYLNVLLSKIKDISPKYRIELLLNTEDSNGETALHIAARNNDREFFDMLVKNGALSTVINNDGRTPTEIMNEHFQDIHMQSQGSVSMSQQTDNANTRRGSSLLKKEKQNKLSNISENSDHKDILSPSRHDIIASPMADVLYASQAATNLNRGIPAIVNSIKLVADNLDENYKKQGNECKNLNAMLASIKKTVEGTTKRTKELLENGGNDDINTLIAAQEKEVEDLKLEIGKGMMYLRNRIEYRQQRRLEGVVNSDNMPMNPSTSSLEERIDVAKELTILQLRRKRKISELLYNYEDTRKIHKYRKMISEGTEMKTEDVDDCLDIILQTLISNNT